MNAKEAKALAVAFRQGPKFQEYVSALFEQLTNEVEASATCGVTCINRTVGNDGIVDIFLDLDAEIYPGNEFLQAVAEEVEDLFVKEQFGVHCFRDSDDVLNFMINWENADHAGED